MMMSGALTIPSEPDPRQTGPFGAGRPAAAFIGTFLPERRRRAGPDRAREACPTPARPAPAMRRPAWCHPAIGQCLGTGRRPTAAEVESLAERIWRDCSGPDGSAWAELDPGCRERVRFRRAARTALGTLSGRPPKSSE
jgi:hypothetical protein